MLDAIGVGILTAEAATPGMRQPNLGYARMLGSFLRALTGLRAWLDTVPNIWRLAFLSGPRVLGIGSC